MRKSYISLEVTVFQKQAKSYAVLRNEIHISYIIFQYCQYYLTLLILLILMFYLHKVRMHSAKIRNLTCEKPRNHELHICSKYSYSFSLPFDIFQHSYCSFIPMFRDYSQVLMINILCNPICYLWAFPNYKLGTLIRCESIIRNYSTANVSIISEVHVDYKFGNCIQYHFSH